MSIAEAKKYIKELHKRQEDPYLWPDYLTGLPGKAAILRKFEEIFPELGKFSVAYVRIANVHPYLIKYGPDRHAEVIQWAAAALKTTCEKCRDCFVGTVSTHDFVVMCRSDRMTAQVGKAAKIFEKQIESFYSPSDVKKKTLLSFRRDGKDVKIGLMRLVAVIVSEKPEKKHTVIQQLSLLCDTLESSTENVIAATADMLREG